MKGVKKSIYMCIYILKKDITESSLHTRGEAKAVHEPGSRFSSDMESPETKVFKFQALEP